MITLVDRATKQLSPSELELQFLPKFPRKKETFFSKQQQKIFSILDKAFQGTRHRLGEFFDAFDQGQQILEKAHISQRRSHHGEAQNQQLETQRLEQQSGQQRSGRSSATQLITHDGPHPDDVHFHLETAENLNPIDEKYAQGKHELLILANDIIYQLEEQVLHDDLNIIGRMLRDAIERVRPQGSTTFWINVPNDGDLAQRIHAILNVSDSTNRFQIESTLTKPSDLTLQNYSGLTVRVSRWDWS